MDKFVIRSNNKPALTNMGKEIIINRDGALVDYYSSFLNDEEANSLFNELFELTEWKIENTITKGGLKPTSRLVIIMSIPNFSSTSITYDTMRFTPILERVKNKIEKLLSVEFTHAYLNFYRDGRDHIGWHSDKEEAPGTIIASLSLGETRDFILRHIRDTQIAQEIEDSAIKRDYMNRAKVSISLRSGTYC